MDNDEVSNSPDDSSTTEDEDAELITPAAERKWLRAYAAVKLGDPDIYKHGVQYFSGSDGSESDDANEDAGTVGKKSRKTSKPITVKDHERQMLLERGATLDEAAESNPVARHRGYFEEQEDLKREFLAAINSAEAAPSGENEPLIKLRQKHDSEKKTNEFNDWLLRKRDTLTDQSSAQQLEPLRRFWNDPNLDASERYLRDYLLEKRYLQSSEEKTTRRPAIKHQEEEPEEELEKLEQGSESGKKDESDKESNFSEKQEEFENKFNFRFEEPDATFMRRFPRTFASATATQQGDSQPGVIRQQKESKRARNRRERKEREDLERRAARNQLNRERASQRQDLRKRLGTIRKVSGISQDLLEQVFGESDVDDETEFDPAKYEAKMHRLFGDDFYQADDDEKPDSNAESENEIESANDGESTSAAAAKVKKGKKKEKKGQDETKQKLKQFASQAITECKRFDNEMQRLNVRERAIEDGGSVSLPFRYREVAPCDFGLSVDEVLRARDKELNAWVSGLRMVQYRSADEEARDQRRYTSVGWQSRKTRILPSLLEQEQNANQDAEEKGKFPGQSEDAVGTTEKKSLLSEKKKKRKRKQVTAVAEAMETDEQNAQQADKANENAKKKRKRKHKAKKLTETTSETKTTSKVAKSANSPQKSAPSEPESEPRAKRAKVAPQVKADSANNTIATDKKKNQQKKPKGAKKGKRSAPASHTNDRPALSDARLRAYGIDPKKYKYLPLSKALSGVRETEQPS